MNRFPRSLNRYPRVFILASCMLLLPLVAPAARAGESPAPRGQGGGAIIYGLTVTQRLVSFSATAPNTLLSNVAITGLAVGEELLAIDFRPNGEQLYGLGSTSRLYVIDPATGAATAVGTFFDPLLMGTAFGFDFNPVVDRIRVVSDFDQNLRLNPDTGAVAAVDPAVAYAAGDANAGVNPNVVGSAYTNNFPGTATTALYGIDSELDVLVLQNAMTGALTTVGALGVDATSELGFDIASNTGIAYAAINTPGGFPTRLYTIDLGTGAATEVGPIGGVATIRSIAVQIDLTAVGDTVGVYTAATGAFFLRNANSAGPADLVFTFGGGGMRVPLRGDWDGDGDDTIGVYDPATSTFFLRNSNSAGGADLAFQFGAPGAGVVPVTGDWNNDGTDTIGIYNSTTGVFFLRNSNSAGPADVTLSFGPTGAVPITGDWDGDGDDTIGVYVPADGTFFQRDTNTSGAADRAFSFGPPGAVPLAGDFDNNGTDTVGAYVPATGAFFLRNANSAGPAGIVFTYGPANSTPLVGDWDGQ